MNCEKINPFPEKFDVRSLLYNESVINALCWHKWIPSGKRGDCLKEMEMLLGKDRKKKIGIFTDTNKTSPWPMEMIM